MFKDLDKYIEANLRPAIETLKELISIKSEEAPAVTVDGEVYPFGTGVQEAFVYTLAKAEEMGFQTLNVDNYGGHIDFGTGKEIVGVIGHLDVVSAGDDWDFEPYGGEISDGYVLGRGTTDDKGPLVAALYAMKSLKDAGYEPAKTIRMIIGLDEETEWKGMDYYLSRVSAPDFGFTPDSQFPVVNVEKGILHFGIAKKIPATFAEGIQLRKLEGGIASNVVPDTASAVISNDDRSIYDAIKDLASEYYKESGYKISVHKVSKNLKIVASGKAAHASMPEEGLNAIGILFDFLGKLEFANDDLSDFIDFYNSKIALCTDGSLMGCNFRDEESGELTFSNGIVNYDGKSITLTCDIRYPICASEDKIYEAIMPVMDEYGLGVVKMENKEPLFFDKNSGLVKTLMDIYREDSGDSRADALVSGGGTYARACEGIVAFGGLFPGDPDIMHQRNEKLSIDRFGQMLKIYTHALYAITQVDFDPR